VAFEPSAFRQHRCGRSARSPAPFLEAGFTLRSMNPAALRGGARSDPASASVAQWQSRAAPPHRHGFDSCRPHQSPFAWEANLVKARPSEAWLRQDVEAAERWARNLPQAPMSAIRGVRPFSPPLRTPAEPKGLAPSGQTQFGARAGSAGLPCKETELGSSPRCSTKLFPDRPTVGHPVVNRPIQVRILVGEPMRRDRLEQDRF
jgi:hypothetical protein